MAERRMFAKTIVTSDAFLDMPPSARCLYFLLAMLADDDGFVNAPNSVMRQAGSTLDDMKLLMAKRFILTFKSGVIVIKHWKIHNLIQKDRYKETTYLEEKALLTLDDKNAYTEADSTVYPECIQPVSKVEPQVRLGKDSLVQDSVGKAIEEDASPPPARSKRFVPPTVEEVADYCFERMSKVDPQRFVDYYTSNGWMVGKNKMKDWKAAVRTWDQKENAKPQRPAKSTNPFLDMLEEGDYE